MSKTKVLALLEANKNDQGIVQWNKLGPRAGGLRSFGIGLTQLRKLAKQIGRDHDLAVTLWKSDLYDAKVIALLIDDPKVITREQAEEQVEGVGPAMLSHVFSSCDATLAKTSFVVELAGEWTGSRDPVRRSCGYGLLYEVSKFSGKKAPDDAFFLGHIKRIADSFDGEQRSVQGAMGGALLGIGKRNAKLNAAALKVARAIGPIQFYDDDKKCEPLDLVKHLTSDSLKKRLK